MALNKQIVDVPLAGGVETKLYSKLVGLGSSLTLANAKLDEVGVLKARPVFVVNQTNVDAVKLTTLDGTRLTVVDRAQIDPIRIVEKANPTTPTGVYIHFTDTAAVGSVRAYVSLGRPTLSAVTDTAYAVVEAVATGAQVATATYANVTQIAIENYTVGAPTDSLRLRVLYTDGTMYTYSINVTTGAIASGVRYGGSALYEVGFTYLDVGNFFVYQPVSTHHIEIVNDFGLATSSTVATGIPVAISTGDFSTGHNTYRVIVPTTAGFSYGTCGTNPSSGFTINPVWAVPTNYLVRSIVALSAPAYVTFNAFDVLVTSSYDNGTTTLWRSDIVNNAGVSQGPFGNLTAASTAKVVGLYTYWWMLADVPVTTATTSSVQATYVLCRALTTDLTKSSSLWTANTRLFDVVAVATKDNAVDASIRDYLGAIQPSTFDGAQASLITSPVQMQTVVNNVTQRYSASNTVKVNYAAPLKSANLGSHTLLTGGQVYESDGTNFYESNFNQFPEITSVTSATSTGSVAPGTYYLKATYRHLDALGNLHESATSLPATVVVGASENTITVNITNYTAGHRPWRLVVYASTDNIAFYEIGSTAVTSPSTTQAGTQAIVITALAGMTNNTELYTDGGVLDNAAVPSFTGITTYSGRFWGVTANGKLYYSKLIVEGEGVAWLGEVGTQILNTDPGEYWQIAAIDGYLVVFGENTVQVITGDGIDNLGTASSSSLTSPRAIPVNSGTLRDNPILANDDGVWFKAVHGLQLLERNMTVTHVPGLPVDSYTPSTLVAITSVPGEHELRFLLSDGTMLIRDGVTNAWSTQAVPTGGSDAILVGTTHYMLATGGVVYSPSGYDAAKKLTLVTPWIRLGQIQAIQRVTNVVLGFDWQSSCIATINLYYDYNETASETLTHAMTTGTVGEMKQFRWHLGKRCEAVKIGVEIASATAGAKLVSMALELAVKGGLIRLDSAGKI
jgi:hypothetical protein